VRSRQRGVSLVAAVFLLVALAGLGAFAVRLGVLQQGTVTSALRAAQAHHAARAGIAWAAHRAVNAGWCATATLNLTQGGTSGFDVAVQCAETSHVEGGATISVYVITVLAEAGAYGTPDYVSRRLEAKIRDGV
jgi:MSHA biogenesis protein MshP